MFSIGTSLSIWKTPLASFGPKGSKIALPKKRSVPDPIKQPMEGERGVWGLPKKVGREGRLTPTRANKRHGAMTDGGERRNITLLKRRAAMGEGNDVEREEDKGIPQPAVQSQGGNSEEDKTWDSEVRLRTYCMACGTAGGIMGLVAGVWLGSSSCEETAWWNPLAALRAVRSAGQNPILRAFPPHSVEGLHLATAGIISTAVGDRASWLKLGWGSYPRRKNGHCGCGREY